MKQPVIAIRLTRKLQFGFALLVFSTGSSCANKNPSGEAEPLRVFAAASLASVMPEIVHAFQKYEPDILVEFNFAATSFLAKQIENGAAADVFLSAHPLWIDYLISKRAVTESTRRIFISNELVVITPEGQVNIARLKDLLNPNIKRIAIADWTHVPAGMYAKAALEKATLWEPLAAKWVPALDVRAALSYVERKAVDCGIVYRSDAAISKKIAIALPIPKHLQPQISYSAAQTATSSNPQSTALLSFLISDEAIGIFEKHGFVRQRK